MALFLSPPLGITCRPFKSRRAHATNLDEHIFHLSVTPYDDCELLSARWPRIKAGKSVCWILYLLPLRNKLAEGGNSRLLDDYFAG